MPHKGAHVLLEALRGLPQEAFEVSLYGMVVPFWQSYVDRLQETARGLPVRFCGVYPHEEVSTVLARHDVLVMPGVCEETFSLMTREALLAGLPVVAARRGALPEVIQDEENGLLFEPENAADLRRCLTRLINEPELVERLRAAPPRVKAIEAYAQDMEEIYAEVCAPAVRVPTLQRQLVVHSQKATALRQESEHLHAENTTLRAQVSALQERCCQIAAAKATVERERDSALLSMQEVSDRLCLREGQLQEREERLKAIYASTTWKLYRCYAALEHWVVHWPAAVLRRWLHK
jgi:regulator of replication initiation timing